MMRAPRLPIFRISGTVSRGARTTVVDVVARNGATYRLRREFADGPAGRIDATRLLDLLYDHGTIDPAKWVRTGHVDDLTHEGLWEAEVGDRRAGAV